MKKLLCYILTFILAYSSFNVAVAAQDSNDYVKYTSTVGNYEMSLRALNNINYGFNTFYDGQQLKDYLITQLPEANNKTRIGGSEWETPNYILVDGKQTVNIIFTDYESKEKIVFPFTITSVPFKKTITGGPTDLAKYTAGTGDNYTVVTNDINFIVDGKKIDGNFVIDNWDSSQVGTKEFNWTFTPTDSTYETKTGTIKVKFFQKIQVATEEAMTLTASKVMLMSGTTYDINIDNKDDDSTYSWISSDNNIAKVNSKGIVTPVAKGKAVITCTVTDSNGNKKDLTSTVTVGEDDNYVSLSDADIDLEVGDTQKLTLDNKVKGSTYKWTTSNKKVAKVTTTSGKVTGIGKGDCYITCTVTDPNKEVTVLRCDVMVE